MLSDRHLEHFNNFILNFCFGLWVRSHGTRELTRSFASGSLPLPAEGFRCALTPLLAICPSWPLPLTLPTTAVALRCQEGISTGVFVGGDLRGRCPAQLRMAKGSGCPCQPCLEGLHSPCKDPHAQRRQYYVMEFLLCRNSICQGETTKDRKKLHVLQLHFFFSALWKRSLHFPFALGHENYVGST